VVVESPTYYGILELIGSLGLRVVELPAHPSEGIDLAALRTVLDSVPKIGACLFVTNHSNPLGCTLPTRRKVELAEILTGRNIPLIEDDIYGDLNQPGTERPPVVKSFDQNGLVLLCGSVSKIISPGLRVGWIHPGKFRQKVAGIKAARTLASPSITQMAVAEFLEHGAYDSHLRRIRAFFAEQIIRFSAAIADYFPPETKVSRPSGGFALWIELPPEIDTVELARRAMNQHQIAIAPGCIFSASGARFGNCFRMSCGYPWSAKIESAVRILGKLVWELGAKA
jgi:DNA-binding transcriptional MocR family regulator